MSDTPLLCCLERMGTPDLSCGDVVGSLRFLSISSGTMLMMVVSVVPLRGASCYSSVSDLVMSPCFAGITPHNLTASSTHEVWLDLA
jgi:hypothetical protein